MSRKKKERQKSLYAKDVEKVLNSQAESKSIMKNTGYVRPKTAHIAEKLKNIMVIEKNKKKLQTQCHHSFKKQLYFFILHDIISLRNIGSKGKSNDRKDSESNG